MAAGTRIEWTEATWNPITGCTKTSDGCLNCYAERMANRLLNMNCTRYKNGFCVTVHHDKFDEPLKWKKPRKVFVNSMSDLYHEDISFLNIGRIFEVMGEARQHVFQILTKRAERMAELVPYLPWPVNVWQGVTVENSKYMHRIELLREVPSHIRFVSFEPLIGPIRNMDLTGIQWVIVGGESGSKARVMEESWARRIRDMSKEQGVPFYFKQWGDNSKHRRTRKLDGRLWEEYPQTRWTDSVAHGF